MPVIGANVLGRDAERVDPVDRSEHSLDVGQPDWRSRMSPPGVTYGTVVYRSFRETARMMSMRLTTVP